MVNCIRPAAMIKNIPSYKIYGNKISAEISQTCGARSRSRCRATTRASSNTSSARTTCVDVGWSVWQHYIGYASQRIVAGMGAGQMNCRTQRP